MGIVSEKIILEFINSFKKSNKKQIEDMFLHGLCYWFAEILENQFHGVKYYDPVENHFICKIGSHYYDIRGQVDKFYSKSDLFVWSKYEDFDELDYKRVLYYCKDLKD